MLYGEGEIMKSESVNRVWYALVFLLIGAMLWGMSQYRYLLFHTVVELFSIIIAYAIFMFALNTRKYNHAPILIYLGTAYFFIGSVDLLHTIAYKGMNIFVEYDSNLPVQLWIIARFMESLTLLAGFSLIQKEYSFRRLFTVYLSITAIFVSFAFLQWGIPVCYVEGEGLTLFKKVSEYVIIALFVVSLLVLRRKRDDFDRSSYSLLETSIALSIAAEFSFTLYVSMYGIPNILGHYFKILSFYCIYKAIIQTGLMKPYALLFRKLAEHEQELIKERDELLEAQNSIKTLSGLVPICSNCKKIRDDSGYWNRLEQYIESNSDARFSHGLCPECTRTLYKDEPWFNEEGSETE